MPLVSRPILKLAATAFDNLQMGDLIGSFVVVMVLFIIPITLLGMVSPIAIRLAITTPEEAGKISGRIYAISTMGSFIGTFLPVLLLIPLLGTTNTFITDQRVPDAGGAGRIGAQRGLEKDPHLAVDAGGADHFRPVVGQRNFQGYPRTGGRT